MNRLLILIGIFIAFSKAVLAAEYIVPESGNITATIAEKGLNTVAIEFDRIKSFTGIEGEYEIKDDGEHGTISITPLIKAPSAINVSITTEKGKKLYAKLNVKDIEPQTVVLKYHNTPKAINSNVPSRLEEYSHSKARQYNINSADLQQETIELIKLAHNSKIKSKPISKLSCLSKYNGLSLVSAQEFSFNDASVIKANISNKSKSTITLDEQDFKGCVNNLSAIAITEHKLPVNSFTTLYLVGKNG
jgi:hypothetical protein